MRSHKNPNSQSNQNDGINQQNSVSHGLIVNTIYTDLDRLQRLFGRFKLCNKNRIDAETWVSYFEAYLSKSYPSLTDIFEYIHLFLD